MRSVLSSILIGAGLLLPACGDGAAGDSAEIVVSTSVLGEVVREVVGDDVEVAVLMPAGADPHDFAPSARDAEAVEDAELVVVVGAGFEERLLGVVEASGADVFAFADHVDLLDGDPHVWTDPSRMAVAVRALAERLGASDAFAEELEALDAELAERFAAIPPDRRRLVTDHDVLGYLADRYDFEILGSVVPSRTTSAQASAAGLEELADAIEEHGVRAIFQTSPSTGRLVESLADLAGVDVVELFVESLGQPGSGADTYVGMLRTNADRIVAAAG